MLASPSFTTVMTCFLSLKILRICASVTLVTSSPLLRPSLAYAASPLLQLLHHLVEIEACRLLPDRKFLETCNPIRGQCLHRHLNERAIHHPLVVFDRFVASFERIGTQVEQLGDAQTGELALPNAYPFIGLLEEDALPFVDT